MKKELVMIEYVMEKFNYTYNYAKVWLSFNGIRRESTGKRNKALYDPDKIDAARQRMRNVKRRVHNG